MQKKVEYIYHWNRIIRVGAVLLAVIGLATMGFLSWFSDSPPSEQRDTVEVQESARPNGEVSETSLPLTLPSPDDAPTLTTTPMPPADVAMVTTDLALPQPFKAPIAGVPTVQTDSKIMTDDGHKPAASIDSGKGIATDDKEKPGTESLPSAELALPDPTSIPKPSPPPLVNAEVLTEGSPRKMDTPEPPIAESALPEAAQASANAEAQIPDTVLQAPEQAHVLTADTPPSTSLTQVADGIDAVNQLPATASGEQMAEAAQTEPSGQMNPGDLSIYSSVVQRFQLAKNVIKLEPRGSLNDIVFDKRDMTAVYCFSEIKGLKHPDLTYVWYHKDKVVARVKVKVGGKRWRSYSSKLINRSMQGDWRVELRGKDKELLASAEFIL